MDNKLIENEKTKNTPIYFVDRCIRFKDEL